MKLHFGFTILLNSPNEFVCDHMPVADARATRASESRDRELVGATNPVSGVDLWIMLWKSGCVDPIGSGGGRGAASFLRVRSLQSRSHSSSRESTSGRRHTPHRGPGPPRVERDVSIDLHGLGY